MPWLYHAILATVFGSLSSFLQSGGRLLRSHPSLEEVVIQDHGGNWHRHGSLNADRQWNLSFTPSMISGIRAERMRSKEEREPFRCPRCALIIMGTKCPCGFEVKMGKRSRPVIQSDGSLKEMVGDIYKPRRISTKPNAAQLWRTMYYRSIKADRTFCAGAALFAMENNWGWPSRDLPLMPKNELDWYKKVKDVPREALK